MDKTSMLYWFPRVQSLEIPIPTTFLVKVENTTNLFEAIDDFSKFPPELYVKIRDYAKMLGYPVFIRTDQLSGKWSWNKACFVSNEKDLVPHLARLIEESAMAGIMGLTVKAFVIRRFLQLDSVFLGMAEMPVSKERRYFIKDGKVICHHPYWQKNEFRKDVYHIGKRKIPEDWERLFDRISNETEEEIKILTKYSEMVAAVLPEFWSVDYACSKNGIWYLIDMAEGEKSYHPSTCPNCPEHLRQIMADEKT